MVVQRQRRIMVRLGRPRPTSAPPMTGQQRLAGLLVAGVVRRPSTRHARKIRRSKTCVFDVAIAGLRHPRHFPRARRSSPSTPGTALFPATRRETARIAESRWWPPKNGPLHGVMRSASGPTGSDLGHRCTASGRRVGRPAVVAAVINLVEDGAVVGAVEIAGSLGHGAEAVRDAIATSITRCPSSCAVH